VIDTSQTTYTDAEIEEDRQSQIADLLKSHETTIEGLMLRYQNVCGAHEALHTAFIFQEIVEHYLSGHPIITLDPVAYRLAHGASSLLSDLYQRVGHIKSEIDDD
jgi:hypothetical protein